MNLPGKKPKNSSKTSRALAVKGEFLKACFVAAQAETPQRLDEELARKIVSSHRYGLYG